MDEKHHSNLLFSACLSPAAAAAVRNGLGCGASAGRMVGEFAQVSDGNWNGPLGDRSKFLLQLPNIVNLAEKYQARHRLEVA